MNREIKFRIPHYNFKTDKFSHFSYWGAIDVAGNPSLDGGTFTSPSANNHTYKKWHEQYTGLKDKNGADIFEGDIVQIDWQDLRYKIQKDIVEWDSDKAQFTFGAGSVSEVNWSHEVIGNIHKNPELLK